MNDDSPAFPVAVTIDAARSIGNLPPMWRFFGADEPNYAYLPDGEKLLADLGSLAPDRVYFRAHNLLTTGDGTPALKWGSTNAYTEDADGNPVYDWTITDRIFDTYRKHGVRPYVQIGFMPEALSVKPQPYQHSWTPTARYEEIYTGWAYPPRDWDKWGELVYQWAAHCVERYGKAEVETWYWQVWNEANIGYWRGTPDEFLRLHDTAIAAVRRALPTAHVGGADTAGVPALLRDFLTHCSEVGTPLDFISFHAKGQPTFTEGHVRMGIREHLRTINDGFALVASFPEWKHLPIVIGESDPEGCAACQGPSLGYRNGTMYAVYTAASFARKWELAALHGVNLEGALTWAFTFPGHPLFAGFRQLATGGIGLPVLNVFRMFARLGGERLLAESTGTVSLDTILDAGVRAAPDVTAVATRDADRISILLWHYHDDDLPGPDADVTLTINGLPAQGNTARLTHYRIDAGHGNAYAVWQALGSPAEPTPEQYAQLEAASRLTPLTNAPETVPVTQGQAVLRFALPRQAVSLLELSGA